MNFGVLLSLFTILLCLHTGLCIDCHQCASWDSDSCVDGYDPEANADNVDGCDDRDTHCLKVKIILKLYDSGFIEGDPRRSVVVSRGCIRADGQGDYCQAIETASGVQLKCLCSTDECNSAPRTWSSLTLTFVLAFLTLLL